MSIDTERLVLSEVHVGSSTLDEEEVVSRYTYLTPPPRPSTNSTSSPPAAAAEDAPASSNADHGSSEEDRSSSSSSSSSGGESEEGSYSRVTRHRKRLRTSSRRRRPAHEVLTVVHRMATTLGLVGQQVWSAAFLLSDFVLTHEHLFAGKQVLELGAGPGVVGLVAARVADRCYLTDYHQEVLKLLARNAEANRHLFAVGRSTAPAKEKASAASADRSSSSSSSSSSGSGGGVGALEAEGDDAMRGGAEGGCVVAVRELDWFTFSRQESSAVAADCDPADEGQDGDGRSEQEEEDVGEHGSSNGDGDGNGNGVCRPFSWERGELEGLSLLTSSPGGGLVLVAADVVYDECLTEAFFHVLRMLMPIPAPPVPAGRHRRDKLAGDLSDNVTSTPNNPKCGGSVDETPSVPPACGDSVRFKAAASGNKPTGDEPVFRGAEGRAQSVLYLALEKRFNFSMAELSVAATGYNALLRNVVLDTTQATESGAGVDRSAQQGGNAQKEFEGRKLPLSFQQCFRYTRNDAMELWEIRRRPATRPKT